MTLLSALEAEPGSVISLVGGGGKTSLGTRLVHEAAACGLRAIFTTTTHIYPPDLPTFLIGEAEPDFPGLRAALKQGPICTVSEPTSGGKLAGIAPDLVCHLRQIADLTVVEADGSAGRPLKYPLAHEPVIPPCTTLVLAVAGASVVGKPLRPHWVHRAEEAAAFLGEALESNISVSAVAKILWHPNAATRGRPLNARVVPIINQADLPNCADAAVAVARALLGEGAPLVLVTNALAQDPVVMRMAREDGGGTF